MAAGPVLVLAAADGVADRAIAAPLRREPEVDRHGRPVTVMGKAGCRARDAVAWVQPERAPRRPASGVRETGTVPESSSAAQSSTVSRARRVPQAGPAA